MRIEAIIARELRMRLRAPFETSFGTTWSRRILLLEVLADGISGWGEITAMEDPFYSPETTDTAWAVLNGSIIPLVLGKEVEHTGDLCALMAPIRGHQMARAGVESALCDVEAQVRGLSLSRLLGGTRKEIACGVSLGIQADTAKLLDNIERETAAGYQRIKVKIKPGRDAEVLGAIRAKYPGLRLMADANSAYSLADLDLLQSFDDFGLMMIEQPLAWDDIYEHALLQTRLRTPVCLDESIHNARHADAAIALGACRIINIKLGRVGGHSEARRVHDVCLERGIPVWCGGMLESGVGRAHNIALASLPGFSLPGDVSASERYWEEDIIDPPVCVTGRGTISVPDASGLGFEVRKDRVEKLTVRKQEWRTQVFAGAGKEA